MTDFLFRERQIQEAERQFEKLVNRELPHFDLKSFKKSYKGLYSKVILPLITMLPPILAEEVKLALKQLEEAKIINVEEEVEKVVNDSPIVEHITEEQIEKDLEEIAKTYPELNEEANVKQKEILTEGIAEEKRKSRTAETIEKYNILRERNDAIIEEEIEHAALPVKKDVSEKIAKDIKMLKESGALDKVIDMQPIRDLYHEMHFPSHVKVTTPTSEELATHMTFNINQFDVVKNSPDLRKLEEDAKQLGIPVEVTMEVLYPKTDKDINKLPVLVKADKDKIYFITLKKEERGMIELFIFKVETPNHDSLEGGMKVIQSSVVSNSSLDYSPYDIYKEKLSKHFNSTLIFED